MIPKQVVFIWHNTSCTKERAILTVNRFRINIPDSSMTSFCQPFLPRLNWTWRAFRVPNSCCWSVRLKFSRDNDFTNMPRSTASVVLGIRSLSSVNMMALECTDSLKLSSSIKPITSRQGDAPGHKHLYCRISQRWKDFSVYCPPIDWKHQSSAQNCRSSLNILSGAFDSSHLSEYKTLRYNPTQTSTTYRSSSRCSSASHVPGTLPVPWDRRHTHNSWMISYPNRNALQSEKPHTKVHLLRAIKTWRWQLARAACAPIHP